MNRERMPAKICKFVETFLPVDLYLPPMYKKSNMVDKLEHILC